MDRIESLPRTRELRMEPAMAPVEELRRQIGIQLSDEEFLLRATMPAGQVDAMRAAGPAARCYDPSTKPTMSLIRQLTARRDLERISVRKGALRLELKRSSRNVPPMP
jgi:oxaloacetate decarboxylase alpha subunit